MLLSSLNHPFSSPSISFYSLSPPLSVFRIRYLPRVFSLPIFPSSLPLFLPFYSSPSLQFLLALEERTFFRWKPLRPVGWFWILMMSQKERREWKQYSKIFFSLHSFSLFSFNFSFLFLSFSLNLNCREAEEERERNVCFLPFCLLLDCFHPTPKTCSHEHLRLFQFLLFR